MIAYSLPCTRPALLFCTWLFCVAPALQVIASHMPMSRSHFHCSFASKIKSNSATSYSHNTLIYSYTFKIFLFIILGQTQNDGDASLYLLPIFIWTLLGLLLSKAIYSCWIIISITSHYHMLKLFPIFIWNLLGLLLSKAIYSCWIMISITSHYHMLRCFFYQFLYIKFGIKECDHY